MKTFSGFAPLPGNDVKPDILDIVFHLGRTRRFGGWGDPSWTVLHHSMLVALLYAREYGMHSAGHALLHDAHEAFTGDVPSPVKDAVGREAFHAMEADLDRRIYAVLEEELPTDAQKQLVHYCDLAALFVEAYHFGPAGTFKHMRGGAWADLDDHTRSTVLNIIHDAGFGEIYDALRAAGKKGTKRVKKEGRTT